MLIPTPPTPKDRGERLKRLIDVLYGVLAGSGTRLRDEDRIEVFHVLANDIYGNAPIDIPRLYEGPYQPPARGGSDAF